MLGTEWVLLREFASLAEADVTRSLLESCGINAKVFGVDENQVWPHLSVAMPVRLMVQVQFLEEARKILDTEAPRTPEVPQDSLEPRRASIDAQIKRAYQAAIYGAVILPVIMQIYSLYLLGSLASIDSAVDMRQKSKAVAIGLLNIVVIGIWTVIFLRFNH